MKKSIAFFLVALFFVSALTATNTYNGGTFPIYGYCPGNLVLNVDNVYDTRFSMTSDIVQIPSDTADVSSYLSTNAGFHIGFWSFYSDYANTQISFTVSPLKNDDSADVYYYLQIGKPDHSSTVINYPYQMDYIKSDNQAHSYTSFSLTNKAYYMTNGPLYVKLAEENQKDVLMANPSNYPKGLYTSLVTITITADDSFVQ